MFNIYRAVKTAIITQGFYDNISSVYKQSGMKCHGGIDIATYTGEPIYFDYSGRGFVLNTEVDSNGGLGINIITDDDNGTMKHRYWHLKKFNCVAGQRVETGDLIGWADNTGISTGPHLHRDIKEMINNNGVYQIKNPNNGTYGTIDYSNYFKNMFVGDVVYNWKSQISLLNRVIELLQQLKVVMFGRK